MTEQFDKTIEKITDRGDAAVLLFTAATSFFLDVAWDFVSFLDPLQTSLTFATGALGIKKAVDVRLTKSRNKRKLLKRTKSLKILLETKAGEKNAHLLAGLIRDEQLFSSEIMLTEDFEKVLKEIIEAYRAVSSENTPAEKLKN